MSNYATKSDLKKTQQVQIHHNLLKKDNLAYLKLDIDKLDIYLGKLDIDKLAQLDADQLKSVPVDLEN